jgi:signal transduction histidine kinase
MTPRLCPAAKTGPPGQRVTCPDARGRGPAATPMSARGYQRLLRIGSCLVIMGDLIARLWRRLYHAQTEQAEPAATQTQLAQQENIRARVLEERARAAREIHDVLAHTLGGLVVQLAAADALLGDGCDPQRVRLLVTGARRLAIVGLDETRRAIRALSTDPVALPEALASFAASRGSTQLSFQVHGSPRQLPPEAGLTIYRTAQEALANAGEHAPGAPVTMTLAFTQHQTTLNVTNPRTPDDTHGTPKASPAVTCAGDRLEGLTERAALLGGTLQAGPDRQGRWTVELRIPT